MLNFTFTSSNLENTLIDIEQLKIHARWRFVISVYLIILFGSWTLFALIWYLISHAHNDLTIDGETGKSLHEGAMKCVEGASSFTEFFLLSFELQVIVLKIK